MTRNDLIGLLILVGLLDVPLVVLTWYYKKHLPQTINWWYGYRTTRSMRSQAAWRAANEYSSALLLRSLWYLPVAQLVSGSICGALTAAITSVLFVLVQATTIIVLTERRLRRSFPDNQS